MSQTKKITPKKVLKFIALALIAIVYILLIGRMSLAKVRGDFARYLWTETGSASFAASPDDYEILTAYLPAVIDEDTGYYSVSDFTFVRETGEVQLTVRYNNSTVKALDGFYPERPNTDEDFVFVLTDDSGNVYKSYKYIASSNLLYNFRRVVFEGVDFNDTDSLYFTVYYINDASDVCPMTRRYKLLDGEMLNEVGYLTESDIKVNLKNTKPENFKLSPEFELITASEENEN